MFDEIADIFMLEDSFKLVNPVSKDESTKQCNRCKLPKPIGQFGLCATERDGHRSLCKDCRKKEYRANADEIKAERRARYAEDPEIQKALSRTYYQNNTEKVKARTRSYYQTNRDEMRVAKQRYAQSNVEAIRDANHNWRLANLDDQRAKDQIYGQTHREQKREYEKQYRTLNPGWDKSKKQKRRAAIADGGHFSSDEWAWLCCAWNYSCACCGKSEPEVKLTADHIVPLSRGGSNEIGNIQPLCGSCNSRKGVKTVNYFREWPTGQQLHPALQAVFENCFGPTSPFVPRSLQPGEELLDKSFGDGSSQPLLGLEL